MITYLNIPSNTPFLKIGGKTYLIDKEDYEKYAGCRDYFQIVPLKEFIDKKGNNVTVVKIYPHEHLFVYETTLYSHQGKCKECGLIESWENHKYILKEVNEEGAIKIHSVCEICGYEARGGVEYESAYKYIKNKIGLDNLDKISTSPEQLIRQVPKILEKLDYVIDMFVVEKEWQTVYYVCSFCQEQMTAKDRLKKHIYEHLREEWESEAPDPDWREWITRLEFAFHLGNIKDRDLILYICPLCGTELEGGMEKHLRNEIKEHLKKKLGEIVGQEFLNIIWNFIVNKGKDERVEKMPYDKIVSEIQRLEANRYYEVEEDIVEKVYERGEPDYDPLYDDYDMTHLSYGSYTWKIVGTKKVLKDSLENNSYYYALVFYKIIKENEEKRKEIENLIEQYKAVDENVNKLMDKVVSIVRTPREVQIKRKVENLQSVEKQEFEKYKKEYESLWDKAGEIMERVETKIEKGISRNLTGKNVMLEILQKIEWSLERISEELSRFYIPNKIYEFLKDRGLIEKEETKTDPWVHYEWHTVYVKGGVVYNVDDLGEKTLEKLNLKDEYLKYIEPLRKKNEELLKQVDLLRKQIGEIKNKIKSIK